MVFKKYLFIIGLSIILVLSAFSPKTVGKTERTIYSGYSEHWEAQYAVDYYPNMTTNQFFSLRYKGNRSEVYTEIYLKYSNSSFCAEMTRITLPDSNTLKFSSGSSYSYHGNVHVLIKWNNTQEEFDLQESKIMSPYLK